MECCSSNALAPVGPEVPKAYSTSDLNVATDGFSPMEFG